MGFVCKYRSKQTQFMTSLLCLYLSVSLSQSTHQHLLYLLSIKLYTYSIYLLPPPPPPLLLCCLLSSADVIYLLSSSIIFSVPPTISICLNRSSLCVNNIHFFDWNRSKPKWVFRQHRWQCCIQFSNQSNLRWKINTEEMRSSKANEQTKPRKLNKKTKNISEISFRIQLVFKSINQKKKLYVLLYVIQTDQISAFLSSSTQRKRSSSGSIQRSVEVASTPSQSTYRTGSLHSITSSEASS